MATLAVCLLTYERTDYAVQTLSSTLDKLQHFGKLHVHIADDGSSDTHRSKLFYAAQMFVDHKHITMTNSERGGYGRNVNLATQVLHSVASHILMLEDDWELTRVFNPYEVIDDMELHPPGCYVDCVRLGYLGFTQSLYGKIVDLRGRKYLILDPQSPEPHVWAGHPRIESVARQREMGEWPEGLAPGATEFVMAHLDRVRQGVAWPMDLVRPCGDLFAHIGTIRSY